MSLQPSLCHEPNMLSAIDMVQRMRNVDNIKARHRVIACTFEMVIKSCASAPTECE